MMASASREVMISRSMVSSSTSDSLRVVPLYSPLREAAAPCFRASCSAPTIPLCQSGPCCLSAMAVSRSRPTMPGSTAAELTRSGATAQLPTASTSDGKALTSSCV